ncbi:MAG: L-seryl-tRNA(Sec) selenium transferase, partial [Alphaproteobacteria bacterium]|nr:L-seryl-tRNA(Sec) selenium transferase [Alphaproteobacteria bacterium]
MRDLPALDRLAREAGGLALIGRVGRSRALDAMRTALAQTREQLQAGADISFTAKSILARAHDMIERANAPSLKPVINLTGTVLHTNLGRAPLPEEAIAAIAHVARGASNLEYNLEKGARGDRDDHLDHLLAEIADAEAATVVNNNAAAVLLVLNSLGARGEVIVSRGELVEIGGAFRIPDIMKRAGCRLVEVGTTNRTHARDFRDVAGPRTSAIMKVHTSNYAISGFTASVAESDLAQIARESGVPFIVDLGAGALADLRQYGLPYEPTVGDTLAQGADVVTFSGDKLLGGPQAGLIAGKRELIAKIKRNPMKRALRVDKMTIAALEAVLRLYREPERLAERLPAIGLLARRQDEIRAQAQAMLAPMSAACGFFGKVSVRDCVSQIGSGSLPVESLPSAALVIEPESGRRSGSAVQRIAQAFRALPIAVIGRIEGNAFVLDLRCLGDV